MKLSKLGIQVIGILFSVIHLIWAAETSEKKRPLWAPSQNTLSPTSPAHTAIDSDFVSIDGKKYHRFKSGSLAILVPDFKKLSAEDFDQAFCASQVGGINNPQAEADLKASGNTTHPELPLARAEVDLNSAGNIQAFAQIIQKTIKEKCQGGSTQAIKMEPQLDLGVSFIPQSKQSPVRQHSIFNRGAGKNLFYRAEF